jgi:predicted amidohydrolase
MKVATVVAQYPISFSIQSNLDTMLGVLEHTQAGDLVVFPEGSVSGYSDDLSFLARVDQRQLKAGLDILQNEAYTRKINLWVGACILEDGRWHNTGFGFSASKETFIYRKINLATHERGTFTAGGALPVFRLNMPDGDLVIGVQLCRELRFPEQWGWLARRGAQIILHLNNATRDDRCLSVWRSHLISRAAETQRFVISANAAAPKQMSPTIVIAPDGQVIAEVVSDELAVLRVDLELSQVSDWYLDQCRTDVVHISAAYDKGAT